MCNGHRPAGSPLFLYIPSDKDVGKEQSPMTNQLLLAQVLAEGIENVLTLNSFWPVFVVPLATFASPYLIAWWNGRRADKQMDFSKRSKPPELARYKELLEISKAYKDLVNFENVDALAIVSPEYRDIEEARKIALERLSWEQKVLSECHDIQARKRLLKIPDSYIVGQWMGDIRSLPNFKTLASMLVEFILYIFLAFMSIKYIKYCIGLVNVSISPIRDPDSVPSDSRYLVLFFPIVTVVLFLLSIVLVRVTYVISKSFGAVISWEEVARYEYIKIINKYAPIKVRERLNKIISSRARNIARMRYSMVDEEYAKLVNVPKFWRKNNWLVPMVKILSIALPYALLEKFNKSGKPYGSYLDGAFKIDAKSLEDKEPSTQDKAASDKEDKESAETKAENKS